MAAGEPAPRPGPLVVSGLLGGTKGISEGARLTLAGLRHAGLAPLEHCLDFEAAQTPSDQLETATRQAGGVWLLHVNPPELIYALSSLPSTAWLGRYRIGYWAYELERVPDFWVRASRVLHEIWTPSSFVANALKRSGVSTTVRVMPHPVALSAPPAAANRAGFGLPDDAFVVLALGDLASSATRKNLTGAIEAYVRAFERPGTARLVVKIRPTETSSGFLRQARRAADGRADISFITADLSASETQALIASSSVLLSLHRAEGFGLTLAEAFMAGVPALATGWSGNLDFMQGVPELLVDFAMTPVRDVSGVYKLHDQSWAEPDVDSAAQKLRMLQARPDLCRELAERGKLAVEGLSAPWAVASIRETSLGHYVR